LENKLDLPLLPLWSLNSSADVSYWDVGQPSPVLQPELKRHEIASMPSRNVKFFMIFIVHIFLTP